MNLSNLFESAEIQSLAADFVEDAKANVKRWFGSGTFQEICEEPGNCAMVSEQFVSWLRDKNVNATMITVSTAKNPSWAKHAGVLPGSEDDVHTAVIVGSNVVDFTAKQFDKSMPSIRIIPLSKFKSEWEQ